MTTKITTHEAARVLSALASALRKAPNVALDELHNLALIGGNSKSSDLPVALGALVAVSGFKKPEWEAVIKEYRLPIQVKPAESTRDVLGKIVQHLAQDPDSRKRLKQAAQRARPDISPALMNALDFLLK
jgi:hypothetical protein